MVFNTTKINISLLILFVMYICYEGFSITKLFPEVYYDTKGFVIPKNMIWPRILNPSTRVRTMEFESRNDFWNIVPPNGKMVKIGVFNCDFCSMNLRNFEKKLARNEYPTYLAVAMFVTPTLKKRMKEWEALRPNFQFKMGRSDSEEVLNSIEDGSLDVIYIDANHEFDFVKKDIKLWRKKLKSGGLFAGHDFCVTKEERKEKKYKLFSPWCGTYQDTEISGTNITMVRGQDSDSAKLKAAAKERIGKEMITQSPCVDAVMQEIGIGNFSVTLEGKKGLDDDSVTGNPSWYTFF